jgi:hypothetical protein
MPSGVYVRTEEHKKSISAVHNRPEFREQMRLLNLGKPLSENTRKKISVSVRNYIQCNKEKYLSDCVLGGKNCVKKRKEDPIKYHLEMVNAGKLSMEKQKQNPEKFLVDIKKAVRASVEWSKNNPGEVIKNARTGGLIGGKRCHELHPNLAREIMIANNLKYPNMAREAGKIGGKRGYEMHLELFRKRMIETHKKYPNMAKEVGLKYGSMGGQASIRSQHKRPNNLEVHFLDFIQRNRMPYRYTGNGEVWIGNHNPDFINVNGEKKVIELFGKYWHGEKRMGMDKKEHEEDIVSHYSNYGFKCIIFWCYEIYELAEEELLKRIVGV